MYLSLKIWILKMAMCVGTIMSNLNVALMIYIDKM